MVLIDFVLFKFWLGFYVGCFDVDVFDECDLMNSELMCCVEGGVLVGMVIVVDW